MAKDISFNLEDYYYNLRVGAIIIKDNKILLTHNKGDNFFFLPGGRVSIGSDTKESLIREIKEELGIDISSNDIKINIIIENFFKLTKNHHHIEFIYRVNPNKFDSNRDYEVLDKNGKEIAQWYDVDKLDDLNIFPKIIKNKIYNEELIHIKVDDRGV